MLNQVIIPFQPHWREKMLKGIKTCTSRPLKYGDTGNWFSQFGATFKILSVNKYALHHIADNLYKEEGCDSPEEFKRIWIKLHPRKGWVPNQEVFTHFFRKEK